MGREEGKTWILVQLQTWVDWVLPGLWVACAAKECPFCCLHSFQAAYGDCNQGMWCGEGAKYCSCMEMTFLKSSHFFPYAVTFLIAAEAAAVFNSKILSLLTLLRDPQLALLCSLDSSQKSLTSVLGFFLAAIVVRKIVIAWHCWNYTGAHQGVSKRGADLMSGSDTWK